MAEKENSKKTLATNTIMLYIMVLSNYIFSFITVPYQTRVLGAEYYGVLGFATAVITYFQMIMDFGFTLAGTAAIAKNKEDKKELARITESVLICKIVLGGVCFIGMFIMFQIIPQVKDNYFIFVMYLLYALANAMIPDFLYRGMEIMKPITYRTVLVKFLFTCLVFLLVKEQEDYVLVPCIYLLGSIVAVIFAYVDVMKRFGLPFVRLEKRDIYNQMKEAFPFFISRIASTVYGATNAFVLGLVYSGQAMLGYYTAADKVVSLARTGASPIADSIYPYLIAHKDFKLVKKLFALIMPIIIIGAIVLYIIAPQFCEILFGAGYEGAAIALRGLIPVMVMVLPNYIMGFPVMTPLGIANKANQAVVMGAFVQIILLLLLWIFNEFGVLQICIITSITEAVVLLYRCVAVYKAVKIKRETE